MDFSINQDIIEKTVEHYGKEHMTTVCMEECAELIQAISKLKRGGHDHYHLAEEMADVIISLSILQEVYGIDGKDIQKWIAGKQARTMDRMGY